MRHSSARRRNRAPPSPSCSRNADRRRLHGMANARTVPRGPSLPSTGTSMSTRTCVSRSLCQHAPDIAESDARGAPRAACTQATQLRSTTGLFRSLLLLWQVPGRLDAAHARAAGLRSLRRRFPDALLPQRSVRAVSMKRRIRGHRRCAVFVDDPICKQPR